MVTFQRIKAKSKRAAKYLLANAHVVNPFRKMFTELEFETTSYCNRKCPYCPVSMYPREGAEDGRYMPWEIVEKLTQDLKSHGYKGMIAPHMYGEPLTDPRIVEICAYLKKELPGIHLKLVTNGDYLNEEVYGKLIGAGVDRINLSKHGKDLSEGTAALLNSLSEEERSQRFNVLDFYADYKNNQEMFNTRGGEVLLTEQNQKKKENPIMCSYVIYPVINTFGDVVLCCNDYNSDHKFGNIMERSIYDIWMDEKNIAIRHKIFKGHFDYTLCKNCYM